MIAHPERRVVVTGLGIIASNGVGKTAFWRAMRQGKTGIAPIQRFSTDDLPIQVAGEVSDFLVEDHLERKLARRTERMTHFALAAVQEALADARLDLTQEDPRCVGAVIANTFGGVDFAVEQIREMYTRGPRFMSPFSATSWLQVANVGQSSLRHGFQGYCKTPVNDLAGGLDALGLAYTAIRRGTADILFAGGCEAPVQPFVLLILAPTDLWATASSPDAYRPFDTRARGLLLAEGAGICVLEEYEHALRRGAPIYGEIVGAAQTHDGADSRRGTPTGKHYARALHLALDEGAIQPAEIGYISLDGRAIPTADQAEAHALRRVFGAEESQSLPVTVPRTLIGHSYSAAGAIDTITALLALRDGIIPPTHHCEQLAAAYAVNLVRNEPRPLQGSAVLLGARSIGGSNVALAIRALRE